MSILFFWLERGGRWGSSPLTSPANHQKLNVIQKWAFYFFGWRGVVDRFESIDQPGQSSEVECNPKMSISFFWLERGVGRGCSPSTSPGDHQKLKVIEKWAFYYFSWRTSLGKHQKLNVILKQEFYFFGWRGVADGVWGHQPALPIIRRWT